MPATVIFRSGIAERIWQARDVDLPQPDPRTRHLADVVPSVLAAMGVAGFDGPIDLAGDVRGACVLLVDGLGSELLDAHADDAPVMAALRGQTLQAGFPSTTVAGLAAVGTGCRSGEHGLVGLSFRLPGVGVINPLRWRPHPWGDDLRDTAPPEQVQPMPTTFERAASAGVAVSVISGAEFTGSGLTRAVLRGGRYVGVQALGDLAACVRAAVADGGFCYGYHGEVDCSGISTAPVPPRGGCSCGRSIGWSSPWWRAYRPAGCSRWWPTTAWWQPTQTMLWTSTIAPRCSMVCRRSVGNREPGMSMSTTAQRTPCSRRGGRRWQTVRGWYRVTKRSRRGGSASGCATKSVSRIGDVVAAARGSATMVRRTVEPLESSLVGHHGSLTSAEQHIPLLLAYG